MTLIMLVVTVTVMVTVTVNKINIITANLADVTQLSFTTINRIISIKLRKCVTMRRDVLVLPL